MDTPKSPVIKLKTYEIINCIRMRGRPFMYVSIVFTSSKFCKGKHFNDIQNVNLNVLFILPVPLYGFYSGSQL